MRKQIHAERFNLWLSANDTYNWAHREDNSWPGSALSGERLFVQFDRHGLVDVAINGKDDTEFDVSCNELSAIVADYMREALPTDHPAYFVAVGQFK